MPLYEIKWPLPARPENDQRRGSEIRDQVGERIRMNRIMERRRMSASNEEMITQSEGRRMAVSDRVDSDLAED